MNQSGPNDNSYRPVVIKRVIFPMHLATFNHFVLYCLNLNLCPGMSPGRLLWALHTSVQ